MKMTAGETIPLERTRPAVNLTTLFDGFRPLFQTLSADDVNKLSYQIIQVFQGEAGTISDLVRNTASLTNTIADKDGVIGAVIDNLNAVLGDGRRARSTTRLAARQHPGTGQRSRRRPRHGRVGGPVARRSDRRGLGRTRADASVDLAVDHCARTGLLHTQREP